MARRNRRSGSNFFSVLTTGALLAFGGFFAGVIMGVMYEEPNLVLGFFSGNTDEITLEAGMQPGIQSENPDASIAEQREKTTEARIGTAEPDVKSVEKTTAAPVQPAPEKKVAKAPVKKPDPPSVSAAPPQKNSAGDFSIQVGAFTNGTQAESLKQRLADKGYASFVQPPDGSKNSRWRVRVGPFSDRAEAEQTGAKLKKNEKLPTWIVSD